MERGAEAELTTEFGTFRAIDYRNRLDGIEHVALVAGTRHPGVGFADFVLGFGGTPALGGAAGMVALERTIAFARADYETLTLLHGPFGEDGTLQGALVGTLDEYNHDAAQGVDTRFHKQPPWLKPLDQAPYAAFDISFDRSIYPATATTLHSLV